MNVQGVYITSKGKVRAQVRDAGLAEKFSFDLSDDDQGLSVYISNENRPNALLAAAAFNGDLATALRRYLVDFDEIASETEGKYPFTDAGCIKCTAGTVPNKLNTGLCLYHLARDLLGAGA